MENIDFKKEYPIYHRFLMMLMSTRYIPRIEFKLKRKFNNDEKKNISNKIIVEVYRRLNNDEYRRNIILSEENCNLLLRFEKSGWDWAIINPNDQVILEANNLIGEIFNVNNISLEQTINGILKLRLSNKDQSVKDLNRIMDLQSNEGYTFTQACKKVYNDNEYYLYDGGSEESFIKTKRQMAKARGYEIKKGKPGRPKKKRL